MPDRGAVKLWLFEPSPERAARVAGSLDERERERAARLGGPASTRFTDVRGTLRAVLGARLGIAPHEVPIVYGPHGRPELGESASSELSFSVSHSGPLAAIAVARGRTVGVDVQRRAERPRAARLAAAVLAAGERERLARLGGRELESAFLDLWCAKEACAKLVGRGLGIGPRTIAVDDPTAALTVATVGSAGQRCTVRRIHVGDAYAGALALA